MDTTGRFSSKAPSPCDPPSYIGVQVLEGERGRERRCCSGTSYGDHIEAYVLKQKVSEISPISNQWNIARPSCARVRLEELCNTPSLHTSEDTSVGCLGFPRLTYYTILPPCSVKDTGLCRPRLGSVWVWAKVGLFLYRDTTSQVPHRSINSPKPDILSVLLGKTPKPSILNPKAPTKNKKCAG